MTKRSLSENYLPECKICNEVFTAPISLCVQGHSFCSKCTPKLQEKCALCRSVIPKTSRNYDLEHFIEEMRKNSSSTEDVIVVAQRPKIPCVVCEELIENNKFKQHCVENHFLKSITTPGGCCEKVLQLHKDTDELRDDDCISWAPSVIHLESRDLYLKVMAKFAKGQFYVVLQHLIRTPGKPTPVSVTIRMCQCVTHSFTHSL